MGLKFQLYFILTVLVKAKTYNCFVAKIHDVVVPARVQNNPTTSKVYYILLAFTEKFKPCLVILHLLQQFHIDFALYRIYFEKKPCFNRRLISNASHKCITYDAGLCVCRSTNFPERNKWTKVYNSDETIHKLIANHYIILLFE